MFINWSGLISQVGGPILKLLRKYSFTQHYRNGNCQPPPKVRDWQLNELSSGVCKIYRNSRGILDIRLAKKVVKSARKRFRLVADKKRSWFTSRELLANPQGNADDFAIYVWSRLTELGFSNLGMVYVYDHLLCGWHHTLNDFYVMDYGLLTKRVKKASRVFPLKHEDKVLMPIFGFNLHRWWTYE